MRIIGLLLALLTLPGCEERAPPEPEQQNTRAAKLLTLTSSDIRLIFEFTARIEALQSVNLSFEVGGRLAQLTVKEGENIRKGALVASLEPTELQLAVREAEVELRMQAQDLSRKRKVLVENGIAKSRVDAAEASYELQRVRLQKAMERLEDSKISAPFDAYVSQRYFDSHVNVKIGEAVVRLLDLNQLQVVVSVPENLVATANAESLLTAWVEFAFAPDRRFAMTYHENRGEADSLAQTYEVSFLIDNPEDLNILPGMTARATLETRNPAASKSILVPASSVVPMPNGRLSVWVYDPSDQTVQQRPITTDAPTNDGLPVTSGLKPGEQIVVAGASQLQQGMKIRPL